MDGDAAKGASQRDAREDGNQVRLVEAPDRIAEDLLHPAHSRLAADDRQHVAHLQDGVRPRGDLDARAADLGYVDSQIFVKFQLAQDGAVQFPFRNADLSRNQFARHLGFGRLLLAGNCQRFLLLEEVFQENEREDAAYHAQGIGNGVALRDHRRVATRSVGVRLLRSAESRRIGHGSGHDSNHRCRICARDLDQEISDSYAAQDKQ